MLSAGMPELKKESDIIELEKALHINPNLTDRMADKLFRDLITQAVTNRMRRLDNLAHNWLQIKGKNKEES